MTLQHPERSFAEIKNDVIDILKTVYDPEIPIDIYELGLIYETNVSTDGDVHILMTLTSPACPVAESLPLEVEGRLKHLLGVKSVKVEITFDPPWSQELMSEAAKFELGFM